MKMMQIYWIDFKVKMLKKKKRKKKKKTLRLQGSGWDGVSDDGFPGSLLWVLIRVASIRQFEGVAIACVFREG